METIIYTIDRRKYKMFVLPIFGKPTNVASYALNRKIERMIEQERWLEVKHIDDMYYYYLPKEVDDTDEREMIESIEDVARDYENNTEQSPNWELNGSDAHKTE